MRRRRRSAACFDRCGNSHTYKGPTIDSGNVRSCAVCLGPPCMMRVCCPRSLHGSSPVSHLERWFLLVCCAVSSTHGDCFWSLPSEQQLLAPLVCALGVQRFPIPVAVPQLGNLGIDAMVGVSGNAELLSVQVGLGACVEVATNEVCGASIPLVKNVLPV